MLFLRHGAEFQYRILFDAGIAHEYRLDRATVHVGPSREPRFLSALGFIGRQIDAPVWIDGSAQRSRDRVAAK